MESSLLREDITEDVIAIKINGSFRQGMSAPALYDATRGYWKVDPQKAARARYVFSVYQGVVQEVYKVEGWLPAGSIPRPTLPGAETPAGRYEFTGCPAEGPIRAKYVGKSLRGLYRKGEANPVKYFLNGEG